MNILLIEDHELLLNALAHKLTNKGYKVFPAKNGREAIDLAMDNPIDLIVCDLLTPIISGITFLRLRNRFMALQVPVIVMSAIENPKEILKFSDTSFDYLIKKPVQFEKLLILIELIIETNFKARCN